MSSKDKVLSVDGVSLRSGPYTDQEVVSITETNFNETYGDPGNFDGELFVGVDLIEVEKNQGTVSQAGLDSFQAKALDYISYHFHCECPDPNNQVPIAYDIWVDSTSFDYLKLGVMSIVGTTNGNMSWPLSFGPNDEFPAAQGYSFCNNSNRLAFDEIEEHINFNNLFGIDQNHYLTDIIDKGDGLYGWKDLNPNDVTPGDFIMDYRTYRVHCVDDGFPQDDCHTNPDDAATSYCFDNATKEQILCLGQTDLNFYQNEIDAILHDPQNLNRPNEIFLYLNMSFNGALCISHYYEYWRTDKIFDNKGGALYGILKERPNSPVRPPMFNCSQWPK